MNEIPLAVTPGGWYTVTMYRPGSWKWAVGFMGGLVVALLTSGLSGAVVGNGVFEGFVQHIAQQITRDKVDFAMAESCTSWFYEQLKKSPGVRPDVKRLSSSIAEADRDFLNICASLYPGINEARQDFAHSQSTLSLSLTFYQLALVADRDDDERYDAGELRDILASLNVVPLPGDHTQLLAKLTGKFDDVREAIEFTILTDSMQALYSKGYRFTTADQAAMSRMTGES